MMGRSHAISGALVWLTGCAVVEVCGQPVSWQATTVGAGLCAGWALAPDFDHEKATLAQSGGFVTKAAAKGIGALCDVVHDHARTRFDRRPDKDNGHRTLTHTLVWAFGCYVVGAGVGRHGGQAAAAVMVFLGAMMGLLAMFRGERNRRGAPVIAAGLAGAAYLLTPDAAWWLGLATGGGCLIHCLGDSLTEWGCPWLWPIPLGPKGRKRMWYPIGLPKALRFHTGSLAEKVLAAGLSALTLVVGPERVVTWAYAEVVRALTAMMLNAG